MTGRTGDQGGTSPDAAAASPPAPPTAASPSPAGNNNVVEQMFPNSKLGNAATELRRTGEVIGPLPSNSGPNGGTSHAPTNSAPHPAGGSQTKVGTSAEGHRRRVRGREAAATATDNNANAPEAFPKQQLSVEQDGGQHGHDSPIEDGGPNDGGSTRGDGRQRQPPQQQQQQADNDVVRFHTVPLNSPAVSAVANSAASDQAAVSPHPPPPPPPPAARGAAGAPRTGNGGSGSAARPPAAPRLRSPPPPIEVAHSAGDAAAAAATTPEPMAAASAVAAASAAGGGLVSGSGSAQRQQSQQQQSQSARQEPQSQASPFPKFEPFQAHDKDDDDDDDDEYDFGDFADGFDDEGHLGDGDAFANEGLRKGSGGRGVGSGMMPPSSPPTSRRSVLTIEDLEICQRLDEEYDRALEEREIGWTARYASVRQSACFSLSFMLFYLVMGTFFFFKHTDWKLNQSLVFTIYTITTVGYGNHDIPDTPGVQTFIIFYIFVGIATLTIMVAQVYQCIALEATRAQYSRDRAEIERSKSNRNAVKELEMASRHNAGMDSSGGGGGGGGVDTNSDDASFMVDFDEAPQRGCRSCFDSPWDGLYRNYESTKNFLRYTQLGRGVSILLPFAGLIGIGAVVVGPIEGWTFIESVYFAVVSLTTVGFGDYHPTEDASIWFCIFWLPFSVGFMSLYLGSVAHFYIQLSNSNIQRLERQMRRRIRRAKEWAEKERQEASARVEAANAASRQRQQMLDVEEGGDSAVGGRGDDGGGAATASAAQDQTSISAAAAAASPVAKRAKRRVGDYFQTLPTGDETDSEEEEVGGGVGGGAFAARANSKPVAGGTALFGSLDSTESMGTKRREQVITNAGLATAAGNDGAAAGAGAGIDATGLRAGKDRPRGHTMATMKDVLSTIHGHMKRNDLALAAGGGVSKTESLTSVFAGDESVLGPETTQFTTSVRTTSSSSVFGKEKSQRKPSFALRCLVQERVAEIVATEIAGYQSHVEIKDNTLSVTIASLKTTADKWMIPRRARKAFRAVAFEALYFVGEHGLITRGADSLYDLTPFEFHGLFGSFLASMGDADTMELWLDSTKMLAEVDLRRDTTRRWLDGTALASRNLSSDGGSGSDGRGRILGGGATRRTSQQTERLNTVRERQMGRSSMGTAAHTFQPKVAGNAFSTKGP